jgi:tripartite-type tricarboxylate transporter receptor subunit TctC
VISGEVPVAFTLLGAAQPFLKSGQLKAIATTGTARVAALPDVPTVAESGFPGFDVTTWYSILVPAGTPPEAIERLNHELGRVIALPDVRERLVGIGMVPETGTTHELAGKIRAEVARWGPIVKAAGIAQE